MLLGDDKSTATFAGPRHGLRPVPGMSPTSSLICLRRAEQARPALTLFNGRVVSGTELATPRVKVPFEGKILHLRQLVLVCAILQYHRATIADNVPSAGSRRTHFTHRRTTHSSPGDKNVRYAALAVLVDVNGPLDIRIWPWALLAAPGRRASPGRGPPAPLLIKDRPG